MSIPVFTALGGAGWETAMVAGLEHSPAVTVVRRCVDVVDLLAVAGAGQAVAALIAADLRQLDVDAVDRLLAVDVTPVGVVDRTDPAAAERLAALGISFVVPSDADASVVVATVQAAVAEHRSGSGESNLAFSDPAASTSSIAPPGSVAAPPVPVQRGSVIAVWGPAGAPGRTTVAVGLADELARLGQPTLLVDADCYGGVVGAVLGLLDESAGIAAACRQAGRTRLDAAGLAQLCWGLGPNLRVLTGIPRAQRWPELRPSGLTAVLGAARALAATTVVDCGFCLEADEEISFDSVAPRRNGSTLAVLHEADLIIVVGSADPIGMQRVVRGLGELRESEVDAPVWVVLNRVRSGAVPGRAEEELTAALLRFAGITPTHFLPYDQRGLDAALAVGKTLGEARPSSPLRLALSQLVGSITGRPAPNDSARHGPRRFARAARRG